MKILNKPIALIGFLVIFIASIFCPFLKVPLASGWNLFQVDAALFFITMGFLAFSVLLFFMRKITAYQISVWILTAWIILAFVAVYFQIHNYFGFKFVDNILGKMLKLKWGWAVLFFGVFLLNFSVRKVKAKSNLGS